MKLGKLPHTSDSRDLLFSAYRTVAPLPTHPTAFGYGKLIPQTGWGMLGNDQAGDCVWASAAHQTMLWQAATKQPIATFTTDSVLSDYSAVTGYNPKTGANDNGTEIRTALQYRQKTGIIDGSGVRHKIGAYVALDASNPVQMIEALYLFGIVELGIQIPTYAMDRFDLNQAWVYKAGGTIAGGHDVPLVARPNSTYLELVTWAKMIKASNSFIKHFIDEAWAIISPEFLSAGVSPLGFNLEQLTQDLAAV